MKDNLEGRVPRGGKYFYINSLVEVSPTLDGYDKIAQKRIECGNYFLSLKEAEEACFRVKSVLLGIKYERGLNEEDKY